MSRIPGAAQLPQGSVRALEPCRVQRIDVAPELSMRFDKDQKLGETTYATKDVGSNVHFTLAGPGDQSWPAGSYKVDIYLDDKLDRTLTYTVTQ